MLLFDSSSENMDLKLDIKREIDTMDYNIVEVMLDNHVNDETDGSDDLQNNKFFKPKTSTKKFKSPKTYSSTHDSEKRSYKRKKNLDEGLIVVEVDGEKIYQCEICKKLCKDRYKLKTHREIHTSTRNVCCTECGAMFKTLTCLYSHKKIHRERIYHQW